MIFASSSKLASPRSFVCCCARRLAVASRTTGHVNHNVVFRAARRSGFVAMEAWMSRITLDISFSGVLGASNRDVRGHAHTYSFGQIPVLL